MIETVDTMCGVAVSAASEPNSCWNILLLGQLCKKLLRATSLSDTTL